MGFHSKGDFPDQFGSFQASNFQAPNGVESLLGSLDGDVDIFLCGLGNLGEDFSVGYT